MSTIDSLKLTPGFCGYEFMRLSRNLLAVWLAVALGLSAVAVPSFAALQSGCSQATVVDDCDCSDAIDAVVCPQTCSMCHFPAGPAPAGLLVKDLQFHRLGTDAGVPMTSLALPPETTPPRTFR